MQISRDVTFDESHPLSTSILSFGLRGGYFLLAFSWYTYHSSFPHSSLVWGSKVHSLSRGQGRSTQIEGQEWCGVKLGQLSDRNHNRWMFILNSMQSSRWFTRQSTALYAAPLVSSSPWSTTPPSIHQTIYYGIHLSHPAIDGYAVSQQGLITPLPYSVWL